MTLDEVMAELEAVGSEQTRKTFRRHGMPEPMFGVLHSRLEVMRKRIKCDHPLALALWATGNGDARSLAMMVADPKLATMAEIQGWAADLHWAGMAVAVAGFVFRTPLATALGQEWTTSHDEWIGTAGWTLMTLAASREEDDMPDADFLPTLARVEKGVHAAKNKVRNAMMGSLIAIGGRSEVLAEAAILAAQRIGKVEIDHGDTACESPDPETYIRKIRAHRVGKAARQADKATKVKARV